MLVPRREFPAFFFGKIQSAVFPCTRMMRLKIGLMMQPLPSEMVVITCRISTGKMFGRSASINSNLRKALPWYLRLINSMKKQGQGQ